MNSQIEAWRVQAYAANVYRLSQQKGSKLASLVRNEEFTGKTEYFDRLGLAVAQDKVGRNGDTPNQNIDHSKRAVTTITREWGTLIDRKDKVQQIHDPASEYSVAAQNALGRKMDEVLINAAFGNAMSGEDGSTAVALGNAQKVTAVKSAAIDYANIQMLRKAKYLMDAAEVEGRRILVHDAAFLEALLALTEVTSSDYAAVKALVKGEINTFLGFEFVLCQRMASFLATTYDTATYKFDTATGLYSSGGTALAGTEKVALAMVGDGVILGKNPNMIARIDERADKSYSQQVYAAIDCGGVRMEEAKVVQLIYKA
jgi:hypothetical protein